MNLNTKIDPALAELVDEKKKIIFTLISSFINSKLNEISINGSFSNADLLLLLDDVIENLKAIIILQIKQYPGEFSELNINVNPCVRISLEQFEESIDIKKEKIAFKITKKSFLNNNSVFQSLTQLEKDLKSVTSKIMYRFAQCIEKK